MFTNNSAVYGPNIASYAVKVYQKGGSLNEINLKDVGSGVLLSKSLELVLADYDNQQMVLDNMTQIKIFPSANSSKTSGVNSEKVVSGVADFKSLIFVGEPGSQNVTFVVESKALSDPKISEIYGANAFSNKVSVSLRY